MMVNGWRRFTWEDVLAEQLPSIIYNREQGVPISGKVMRPAGNRAAESSKIKLMAMNGDVVIVSADSAGRFYTDDFVYVDSMDFVFQTEDDKGRKKPYKFLLDPFNPSPLTSFEFSSFAHFDAKNYIEQTYQQNVINNANLNSEVKHLQEVEVTARRIATTSQDSRVVGSGSTVIDTKDIGVRYTNILQMLQSRVAGAQIFGNPPNMSIKIRNQEPVFLLNGRPSNSEQVQILSPAFVEKIEVLKGSEAVMYGGASAVNIILKAGAWDREPVGVNNAKYPGLAKAREFYAPRYDVPSDKHNLLDKRVTLYWNPRVITDKSGKATVSFFTGDTNSNYRVILEGITPEGYPGNAATGFVVK